jgi:hypothetical protein
MRSDQEGIGRVEDRRGERRRTRKVHYQRRAERRTKGASVGAVGYNLALRPDVEVLQQLAQVVTEIIDAGSDAQGIAGVYNVGGGPTSALR